MMMEPFQETSAMQSLIQNRKTVSTNHFYILRSFFNGPLLSSFTYKIIFIYLRKFNTHQFGRLRAPFFFCLVKIEGEDGIRATTTGCSVCFFSFSLEENEKHENSVSITMELRQLARKGQLHGVVHLLEHNRGLHQLRMLRLFYHWCVVSILIQDPRQLGYQRSYFIIF